jgi:endonuclease/exonuclease/phosphatase family metal-dependent hydrolase
MPEAKVTKHNVGIAVALQRLKKTSEPTVPSTADAVPTSTRFVVGNTHIYYDPAAADLKMLQVCAFFDLVEKFRVKQALQLPQSAQRQRLPAIVCGDFNSTPDSAVYRHITRLPMCSSSGTVTPRQESENVIQSIPIPVSFARQQFMRFSFDDR